MINELVKRIISISRVPVDHESINGLINFLDLTSLSRATQWAEIFKLCELAKEHRVAGICLLPTQVLQAQQLCKNVVTVINFPEGQEELHESQKAIQAAIEDGVSEIDYVWDYASYLKGESEKTLNAVAQCHALCKNHGVLFKVILETGCLPNIDVIYKASRDVIEAGCDFIKTSTGTTEIGASFEAVYAMLQAIKDSNKSIGVKVSGGINSAQQALQYKAMVEQELDLKELSPRQFRLGSSSLLEEILSTLKN